MLLLDFLFLVEFIRSLVIDDLFFFFVINWIIKLIVLFGLIIFYKLLYVNIRKFLLFVKRSILLKNVKYVVVKVNKMYVFFVYIIFKVKLVSIWFFIDVRFVFSIINCL